MIKLLFIHPVADSQFCHLISQLQHDKNYEISVLSSIDSLDKNKRTLGPTGKIDGNINRFYFYDLQKKSPTKNLFIQQFEQETEQGYAVYQACKKIRKQGYKPDLVICYGRHGAALFIKEVFAETPLLLYSEFFNSPESVKKCLAPGESLPDLNEVYLRAYTATSLISLDVADKIVTPTEFQKLSHPKNYLGKISVIHDGIDIEKAAPGKAAKMIWQGKVIDKHKHEIITYVSRNFESYRGFESFIKAAEIILKERKNAIILVAGGTNSGGYGGKSGTEYFRDVVGKASLDEKRILFLGPLEHEHYIKLLQLSHAHIYLTVPYILSWSMLEAMAIEAPVVGSRTAPVEEFITHKKNGLLVDLYKPDEIAEKVFYLLERREEAKKMAKNAREFINKNASLEVITEEYKNLITSMLN